MWSTWELSILSSQFLHKSKTLLKDNLLLKNKGNSPKSTPNMQESWISGSDSQELKVAR